MHRESEVSTLTRMLREAKPGLQVAAISGPGGVGKSYMIEEIFTQANPRDLEYMYLRIDGSNPQTRNDFMGLIDGQLAARSLPAPASPENDYFPQLRSVAATYREVTSDLLGKLEKKGAPPEVRKAVISLARAAHVFNRAVVRDKKAHTSFVSKVDGEQAAEIVEAGWEAVESLLDAAPTIPLPSRVRDLVGLTRRAHIKRDLYNVTAEALVGDLSAALSEYRGKDWYRFTQAPIPGFRKLVIVLDDFEATSPILSDFVISALMPRLALLSFPVVMFIAGRDQLGAVNPGFNQFASKWIVQEIELRAFDRNEAYRLMSESRVPIEKHERLFELTHGFPYLLSLVIEQATQASESSALFTKKFYERTTRWMNDVEKVWFQRLCYLDVINEDTVGDMFGKDVDASVIQDWFEKEASIRDPVSTEFTIRPLVRDMCLTYFAKRSPKGHQKMSVDAARVNALMAETSTNAN